MGPTTSHLSSAARGDRTQAPRRLATALRRLAPYYLCVVLTAFVTTLAITSTRFGDQVDLLQDKIMPDRETGISFHEKLLNDFGLSPRYFMVAMPQALHENWQTVRDFPKRRRRAAAPLVFSDEPGRSDFIFIAGAFDFPESLHGALLLNRRGDVVHRWPIQPSKLAAAQSAGEYRVFPHGFEVYSDGSLIAAFDGGRELLKITACGDHGWVAPGDYHHSVTADPDADDAVWTWRKNEAVKVDIKTGAVMQGLDISDIIAANPDLDVLGVMQDTTYAGYEWLGDPVHQNDVEALPRAYAAAFPMFEPGDLLLSMRNINLILVVDPQTAKIKWHASGYWRRQHDPDWSPDGRILVYNNNMHRRFSSIVSIDPKTNAVRKVLDGEQYNFYSRIRGKQDWTPDGRLFLSVPDQGRVMEVAPDGRVTFEFVNRYDDNGEALVVSEARSFPADYFNFKEMGQCETQQS